MEKLPLPENLQHPDHAPKDGTTILADFGWPYAVPAMWNAYEQQWAIATVSFSKGHYLDTFFENEFRGHEKMIGWMAMPGIPEKSHHPDHAPKDGTVFLAYFNQRPFLKPTIWNDYDQCWVIAYGWSDPQKDRFPGSVFTTQNAKLTPEMVGKMHGWMAMPEIAGARKEAGLAAA